MPVKECIKRCCVILLAAVLACLLVSCGKEQQEQKQAGDQFQVTIPKGDGNSTYTVDQNHNPIIIADGADKI